MRKEAGVPFYMYTPDRLMREARERLGVEVSNESISEAEGIGRESDDDATIKAADYLLRLQEMWDEPHPLTNDERYVLREMAVQDRDIDSIAEELGVRRPVVFSLLQRAFDKLTSESEGKHYHPGSWSETDWKNKRIFFGRNSPPRHTNTLVDSVSATLRGDEDSITVFSRRLLSNFPRILTLSREPTDSVASDVKLELTFRPPVPFEDASRILEETAREAGVILVALTYTHSES